MRKLEMWFRKDDRQKRNEWAHFIQDHRIKIDDKNKQLIRDNQANLIVSIFFTIFKFSIFFKYFSRTFYIAFYNILHQEKFFQGI